MRFIQDRCRDGESAVAESAPPQQELVDEEKLNRLLRSGFETAMMARGEMTGLRNRLAIREWLSMVMSLEYDFITAAKKVLFKYRGIEFSNRVVRKFVSAWLADEWTQEQIRVYQSSMVASAIRTRDQILAKLWEIAQSNPDGKVVKCSDIIAANEIIGREEFGMFKRHGHDGALNVHANNVSIAQQFRQIASNKREEERYLEVTDEQIS